MTERVSNYACALQGCRKRFYFVEGREGGGGGGVSTNRVVKQFKKISVNVITQPTKSLHAEHFLKIHIHPVFIHLFSLHHD